MSKSTYVAIEKFAFGSVVIAAVAIAVGMFVGVLIA
jgi:hypothetical protein